MNQKSLDEYLRLGQIYYAKGHYFEALNEFEGAYRINPEDCEILEWRGEIAIRLDDYDTAAQVLTMARDNFSEKFNDWSQLGLALYECRRATEAVSALTRAIERDTNDIIAHANLGRALYEMFLSEDKDEAITIAKKWMRQFPENPDAKHMGAAIANEALPDRANPEFIGGLFDDFAENFDYSLSQLGYQVPKKLINLLHHHINPKSEGLKILDLGCGTGALGAEFVKQFPLKIDKLIGIDLSYKMLNKAENHGIYTQLIRTDIVDYLNIENQSFDLILAGDVLCYFGLLDNIMPAIKYALKPSGLLAFSLELLPPAVGMYQLHASGRYRHQENYINALMIAHNMPQITEEKCILRYEYQQPVNGVVKLWQKTQMGFNV